MVRCQCAATAGGSRFHRQRLSKAARSSVFAEPSLLHAAGALNKQETMTGSRTSAAEAALTMKLSFGGAAFLVYFFVLFVKGVGFLLLFFVCFCFCFCFFVCLVFLLFFYLGGGVVVVFYDVHERHS